MNIGIVKMGRNTSVKMITDLNAIKQRASGEWRTSINQIASFTRLVVLFQQTVVAEFDVTDTFTLNRENARITLNLEDVSLDDRLFQVGTEVRYRTPNPFTVADIEDFRSRIEKE